MSKFNSLPSTSAFKRRPAVLHQPHRPPEHGHLCVQALCVHLFIRSHDPSGALSTTSQPTAQHLIGLCTLTSASDWTTHARKLPGWVRKPEGTDADTSLLFWLLLTGVNCYHKAWRMALCVSVVMWACLAIRNMESSLFLTTLSVFLSN